MLFFSLQKISYIYFYGHLRCFLAASSEKKDLSKNLVIFLKTG